MGFKAKYLLNRVNTLTVKIGYEEDGEQKEGLITVHHKVLTPELWSKLKPAKLGETDDPTKDSLVAELLALLTAWDVEGDDGRPLDITEETLIRIDYKILKEIDTAIYAYTFPNLTT